MAKFNYWFVSRQKRQLDDLLPALIAYSDECEGQVWASNKELQLKFEDALGAREITAHGPLRARKAGEGGGGTRTLFTQMADLGLIYEEDDSQISRLTLVGEEIVTGRLSYVEAMRLQLLRYQYPSATRLKGSGSVDQRFNVHPFHFLLRLISDDKLDGYLKYEEIGFIVIHKAISDSDKIYNEVVEEILEHRKDITKKYSPEVQEEIDRLKVKNAKEHKNQKHPYLEIANTLCNYLSITQFVDKGIGTVLLRKDKKAAVTEILDTDLKLIRHPELKENYQRAYGRGTQAKDHRTFSGRKSASEIKNSRIDKEYVLIALNTPIKEITAELAVQISEKTGIDEKYVEKHLRDNHPRGNIDDFFITYKRLAYMGTEGAAMFEKATCEMFIKLFNMKAKHVGPIGNTPDVFVESEEGGYCGIIDNKAYKDGFSITGDFKRVMEDVYIPNARQYGESKYPLAFFSYISGEFSPYINSQLQEIVRDTGINGAAMPVDLFINLAQDYAQKGYNHEDIKRIFSVNREVLLSDI